MTDQMKCVMILDDALPTGVLANTAAILGISMGSIAPEYIGPDVKDASGLPHKGIITLPVPILKSNKEALCTLRETLCTPAYSDVVVVDFSDVAQGCNIYDDYMQKAADTPTNEHTYMGLALWGSKKTINKLTGNMPLLR